MAAILENKPHGHSNPSRYHTRPHPTGLTPAHTHKVLMPTHTLIRLTPAHAYIRFTPTHTPICLTPAHNLIFIPPARTTPHRPHTRQQPHRPPPTGTALFLLRNTSNQSHSITPAVSSTPHLVTSSPRSLFPDTPV
ncbi:uncharacterized protein [Palaemon carinicauda]|uniref:uncharacterized protein n=1 Tax=Palaemon carinicauda TaxID=392227 RepID=UPI0035B63531